MRYFMILALAGFISVPAVASTALSDKYEYTDCPTLDGKPGAARDKKEGPAYQEIAREYQGKSGADRHLVESILKGSKGVWAKKMGQTKSQMDAEAIVKWISPL